MDIANQVRGYSFLSAVLANREIDPVCRSCSSFLSTLLTVTETIHRFELEHAAEVEKLPDGLSLSFLVARSGISGIRQPDHAVPQKKAGNCKLPEGICFPKSSLSILQKIQKEGN